ncbi:hypothetical protein PFICI_04945 [Pestalotiopsis fici W106-1]|uniref:Peroxidase n=1 Tax=Pestalotiopsis fici (strain W106-1 / CGMCC3.15140) TaxID=1229662 RepID=W3XAK5_PESFW|nr:uncharacterized protein PFICI_04945 [Pestalotiopsis fici W106-1]ETS83069.1 hypothetical protein PFICI_04945 [Pestalotiopsis fici W106-1]
MQPRCLSYSSVLVISWRILSTAARGGVGRLVDLSNANIVTESSSQLFGDLLNDSRTRGGDKIARILQGIDSATRPSCSDYHAPGAPMSPACNADKCCIWSHITGEILPSFKGCTDFARGAIRQGFHDAAAWDVFSETGGADGSLLLSDELDRIENENIHDIGNLTKSWFKKYEDWGVSMADLIQVSAITATVACPGGPRIRLFVGRQDSDEANPAGLLPSPFDNADYLISLFENKTFSSTDLVALVGAHSISKQISVDPRRIGASQGITPKVLDTTFFENTLQGDNKTILIIPSDAKLAASKKTAKQWEMFAKSKATVAWNLAYARAYVRMSLLGVNNMNDMMECTKVLPPPIPTG